MTNLGKQIAADAAISHNNSPSTTLKIPFDVELIILNLL